MHVLALDTSTLVASIALVRDDEVLASRDARVTTHSETILVLVQEMLDAAHLSVSDLDAIACGAGPGSFTGLRIGMSTAKGLCYGLDKPLCTVSSLAALAAAAAAQRAAATEPDDALLLACLDAKRDEVYVGLFRATDGQLIAVKDECVLPPEALVDYVSDVDNPGPVVVIGDGAVRYPQQVAACGVHVAELRQTPDAVAIARLALGSLRAGTQNNVASTIPTYIRPSDVEQKPSTT